MVLPLVQTACRNQVHVKSWTSMPFAFMNSVAAIAHHTTSFFNPQAHSVAHHTKPFIHEL